MRKWGHTVTGGISVSEHEPPTGVTAGPVTLDTGLEAFESSQEFGGPVEDLDGHGCNDHFAQIYETPAEKFEAAVRFVRHGLDRGEQVAYVVDQSTEDEVRMRLQDAGIDVETALDLGALVFYTADDTYLRDESFDPDEMIQFYADATAEATEEYEALRLVAEMSWIEHDDTAAEELMEYESKINDLFDHEDVLAICQYDRELFAPEVINNIVRTHPHLIYDGAACHNFYYTPPEELFAEDNLARENERMLRTLHDRTTAKAELQQHDRFLRECYEITSDPGRSFDEKLYALFDLGRERFDLDVGGIAKVDPETDYFEMEAVSGDHEHLTPGTQHPLSETYCRLITEDGETAAVTDPVGAGFEGQLCYERFGVQTYLGTHAAVDGDTDRTFWFLSTESRETPVSDEERTFVDLMGQWVSYELERRQQKCELERTKTRFETVFEQSNDVIFLIDPDADAFVDANSAATEMLGYTRDELASLRPSDVHPDELEQYYAFLEEVLETGSAWSEDLHCRTKDGRDIPAEVSATSITLDGRELVLANVRHIEERKKHERYQRELYDIVADSQASFDAKLDGLLELGRERFGLENGYFNRVDPDADAFEVVTAVGPHDMIEPGAVDALSGTFCERHLDSTEPLAAEDVRDAGLDYLRAHDEYGLEAYFAATVHGGTEEYGTLCFASETPRDEPFTEAERTFLDLMGQCVSYELERNHREAQLERKSDRLESFASLLAHELRNPVTIGQIYSQQLPADADAEAIEYVAEAFDRIEDMVDVLLILTRGREAIGERTPVDLARVARKAWDTVESPDAVLDIELDRTIEADQTYVRHLFRNLLENAVEHGGSDATIRVGDLDDVSASREGRGPSDHSSEQSPREDEASGGSEDEYGESSGGFYVADDGAGIPPEDRNAVFDEGYTTAADNGGTGLGLAFVQKLAEVYEWDLAVTDSADGGARFEFRNLR